jgi:hypothetical protein
MFCVGYANDEEIAELERRDWEVEDAADYNLVGEENHHLIAPPKNEQDDEEQIRAVVIFVSNSLFEVMDGPDWEKG